jgi:Glycosyl hydrolase family 71
MSTLTMHQAQARKNRFQAPATLSLKAAVVLLICVGAGASGVGSAFAATTDTSGTIQPDTTSAATPAAGSIGLPFTMPSTATLQSSPRKVFAHYIPSLPLSLDNKAASSDYYARNYLAPAGEGNKHASYGGFLRDRPLGRPALTGDWKSEDMQAEVRQAISVGIDGFAVDILQLPGAGDGRLWANTVTLLQAAAAVDPNFKIMLTPDMNSSAKNASPAQWASALATLADYSSAYRLSDGRLVVSPFMAEAKTPAWYTSVFDTLSADHGIPVAFVPVFLDDQKYAASYASISYGMGNWGARNPKSNNADVTYSTSPIGRANKVKAMGKIWMQPVSVQDERPSSGVFEEAENTQNLRNTWKIALDSGAEWVNMTTWNDYSEGTAFAPSQKHGWSYLDINAYYLAQFKTGTAPKITKDAVYVTHRTQKVAALVSGPASKLMKLRAGSPARDTVEALTFLKAAGTVNITVGSTTTSCQVDAGVGTCTAPLGTGTVSVSVLRFGATVASVDDPYSVTSAPYAQDLQYVAAGSMSSSGTGTDPTEAAPAQVVTLTPTADTYANAGAPTRNFATSWSMFSRGNIGAVSYLRFAVPATPSGKVLTSAVLRVTTTTEKIAGTDDAQVVSIADNNWNESTLTWNTRPALSTQLGSLASAPAVNQAYQVDLSADGIPTDAAQLTLAISGSGTDNLSVWSSKHSSPELRPQLVLTYN